MPVALLFVVLLDVLSWATVLPVLPSWAQARGAGPEGVALLFGAYAGVQLVASPLLGRLADRLGARRVLLFCLAGSCASFVWLALAQGYPSILASRLLDGATAGNLSIAAAIAARLTDGPARARVFGHLGIAAGTGLVLGPVLCIALLRYGAAAPLWGAAGVSAASLLLALALPEVLPAPQATDEPRAPGAPQEPALLLSLPAPALRSALLLALFFTAHHLFSSGWSLFGSSWYQRGLVPFGAQEVAESFALAGVVVVATQLWLYPRALTRIGERATVALGFAAAALGFAALPLATPGASLSWAIAVTALGTALSRPALTAWLSRATPASRQGEVMGLLQSLQSAAQLAGALLTGALLGQGLHRGWAWGVASLHAAGLLLVLWWRDRAVGAQGAAAARGGAEDGAEAGEPG